VIQKRSSQPCLEFQTFAAPDFWLFLEFRLEIHFDGVGLAFERTDLLARGHRKNRSLTFKRTGHRIFAEPLFQI
jgi:hypothetical protein